MVSGTQSFTCSGLSRETAIMHSKQLHSMCQCCEASAQRACTILLYTNTFSQFINQMIIPEDFGLLVSVFDSSERFLDRERQRCCAHEAGREGSPTMVRTGRSSGQLDCSPRGSAWASALWLLSGWILTNWHHSHLKKAILLTFAQLHVAANLSKSIGEKSGNDSCVTWIWNWNLLYASAVYSQMPKKMQTKDISAFWWYICVCCHNIKELHIHHVRRLFLHCLTCSIFVLSLAKQFEIGSSSQLSANSSKQVNAAIEAPSSVIRSEQRSCRILFLKWWSNV